MILLSVVTGCATSRPTSSPSSVTKPIGTIEYKNTEYGFSFTLPASWENYSIITSQWKGSRAGPQGDEIVAQGPEISIRHPQWTAEVPRQDIPIMVFTLSQWEALQKRDFHIGADPIGPTELWRNEKHVFVLPARYNYAFPKGYEEVN
jgi:hypothetical protein